MPFIIFHNIIEEFLELDTGSLIKYQIVLCEEYIHIFQSTCIISTTSMA